MLYIFNKPYTYKAPYGFTVFPIGNVENYETPNTVYLTDSLGGSNDYGTALRPVQGTQPVLINNEDPTIIPAGFTYPNRLDITSNVGNTNPGAIFSNVTRNAIMGATSFLGNPLTQQFAGAFISTAFKGKTGTDTRTENMGQPYSVMPFTRLSQLENWSITKYKDFRAFKGSTFSINNVRLDGASAATRGIRNLDVKGSVVGIAYAAASAAPGGAYTLFNLESIYGWGNHGEPNAAHRDFTIRSNVATTWKLGSPDGKTKGKWVLTKNPIELTTEFRGDKINVIDYSKRKLSAVYQWKTPFFPGAEKWNNFVGATDLTKDFIKFYFTGPKLQNGVPDAVDDIIVFRVAIDSFTDTHSPSWNAVQMIGRADPNYTYTGYSREVSLSFTVYATSRDEMKPIYRKLNALASYTTPEYSINSIAMKSPWMRMTIGDLLVQQPVLINSLSYTLADADTTWEINIEDDPTMMQAPHKISVSMGLNVITDYLPEKNGKMYTLAKQFATETAQPKEGGDNWLSDFGTNASNIAIERRNANVEQDNIKLEQDNLLKTIFSKPI